MIAVSGVKESGNSGDYRTLEPPTAEIYVVTAYSVGDNYTPDHGITASGERVEAGVTVACPKELPFGTRVDIENVGVRTCTDRGGAIKGKRLDVYIPEIEEALKFGKRELNVSIIEKGAD